MNQLRQKLKSGNLELVEVSIPLAQPEQVLVRNYYSVLSAGTMGKTVSKARKTIIAKARSRHKNINQSIDLISSRGIKSSVGLVMNKLEVVSPIGFSCVGEVLAIGSKVKDLIPGDYIACGGTSASHADILAITENNCIKLDPRIAPTEGAFIAFASLAWQGILLGDLQKRDSCIVFGLGLFGILTMKILNALGIKAIGIDPEAELVNVARNKFGFRAELYDSGSLMEKIEAISGQEVFAAGIITSTVATSNSLNFVGELIQSNGKVIAMGTTDSGFEKNVYSQKELDVIELALFLDKGSKDVGESNENKKEVGLFTVNRKRDMQFIVDLLKQKKMLFHDLISDTYSLENASSKYKLLIESDIYFLAALIEFKTKEKFEDLLANDSPPSEPIEPKIGVIGMGSHAYRVILPLLKKEGNLLGMATKGGLNSIYADTQYNFSFGTAKPERLLNREYINTIFVLTRHNLHSGQLIDSLKSGNHTFIEKPLCLTLEELDEISEVYLSLPKPAPNIMVGFNRRFAPALLEAMKSVNTELPRAINIQIIADKLLDDHWIRDRKQGGGLLLGEVGQFIDLACFIAGKKALTVASSAIKNDPYSGDALNISLQFEGGSIANITYTTSERKKTYKEEIEIFSGEKRILVSNYKSVEIFTARGKKRIKYRKPSKGYSEEIKEFLRSISEGKQSPIPFIELVHSTRTAILANKALHEGRIIHIA